MKNSDRKPATPGNFSPLAIIGIGCLFPQADNQQAYWANIVNGVDAISEVPETHWSVAEYYDEDQKSPDRTYGHRGGFISAVDFNPMEFNIPPNVLEAIDTSQLLGLVAAGQALKDAGYGPEKGFDKSRASVIIGVTGTLELVIPLGARLGHPVWRAALKDAGVDEMVAKDVVERISDSYVPWQENSFPGLLGNVVAGRISKQYDLGGTNCVVDAACASSFSALHLAALELGSGQSDLVVTGGIDTFNDIFMYMCFSKTPALSPTGDIKPFDTKADGTILGEGLGLVVLKRLADAERDGDRIYAVVRGVGSSSDGKGDAIYAPSAGGQKKALLKAYANAGVEPQSIGLIEAHGTGTKVGDAVEVSALREVFGEAERPWCSLGSVKSQIGHTKAAAGAAGLIKAALALHHKVIPPTIKVQTPQPEIVDGATPFYLATSKRPWLTSGGAPRRAGVSAFGFGGSNFHLVVEEYRAQKEHCSWDGDTQLITFSGADAGALKARLDTISEEASWQTIRDLAYASRQSFVPTHPCRLALVVEKGKSSFASLRKNAQGMLEKPAAPFRQSPDGVYLAQGDRPGRLGMIFPGQGSQYAGMLNDLACLFPELLETVSAANDGFAADGKLLSDFVFPFTAFDAEGRKRQEDELRATQVAQPALGAVSLGALKLLGSFGVAPEAVAGHSYGELTALCAAGCLEEQSLHELSRLRGKLMSQGAGSMLAVSAELAQVQSVLAQEKLDLVIANKNAPTQLVLSGRADEIARAVKVFAARNLTCKELPVAAAFHSALVADAATPFGQALEGIAFHPAQLPVYANTTADLYPADPARAKTLLAEQLAKPVEFVAEIEAMYAAGVRTFVEVGPGARLTGLVQAILGDRPHQAFALDASAGKRSGVNDLGRTLAQLAVLGHDLDLSGWDAGYVPAPPVAKKPLLTISLNGANYVKPRPKKPAVTHKPAPATAAFIQPQATTTAFTATPAPTIAAPAAALPQVPTAAITQPAPAPAATVAMAPDLLAASLQATREGMTLLQKMQEETAKLHLRFLEGQNEASKTFQMLLQQQQRLVSGAQPVAPTAAAVAAAPAAAPAYVAPAPAAAPASALAPVQAAPVPPVAPAAAPPAPASQPAAALPVSAPAAAATAVVQTLLDVISEKTGYPVEMLELDMGMDADLGIDSIKRVEILSALQERLPGSPVIGPEHLGTLSTLRDIANHLHPAAGSAPAAATAPATAAAPAATGVSREVAVEALLAVVSEKTGYPVEMLELDMGLDADLGIDSIKRVEILSALQERLPGAPAIGPEHLGTISTLGDIAAHLAAGVPAQAAAAAAPVSVQAPVDVASILKEVVSEKTGYPVEMLELEMGLDSDLGIDSIKRVEILSALQERLPGAPSIGPELLGTLSTLADIATHLASGLPGTATQATNATQATAVAAVSAPAVQEADVAAALLEVVSEKTGYPVEMLELTMGMDADLGIDSIKRVEILSALQERLPAAPVIGPDQLGTLSTLGDIVTYLVGGAAAPPVEAVPVQATPVQAPVQVSATTPVAAETNAATKASAPITRSAAKPVPLEDDNEEALVLATTDETWLTYDGSPFAEELYGILAGHGLNVRKIGPEEAPVADGNLAGLIVVAPSAGTDDAFLAHAFQLVKSAAHGLAKSAEEGAAVCVTVSRLDGAFGFGPGTELVDPLSGGLAGLTKTAAREWPKVNCKAIDLAPFPSDQEAAHAVALELFRSGPVEVGLTPLGRLGLDLAAIPAAPAPTAPAVAEGEVVIVTGGGRGVTAAAALALANGCRPHLVLLGRTPEPLPEPKEIAGLTQESEIKRAIMQSATGKLHPKEIEERYRAILAGRELRFNLAAIAATGAKVSYRALDIRDPQALQALVADLRRELGPIRGVIHGAGVLADRLIVEKTLEQFRQVYLTKVTGLRALLDATEPDELRFIALFSSSTGRFGRIGQCDYAVANEVLNKLAQSEARSRRNCRAVAINWGPWDGGMVTPALKKIFAEEGIGVIDLQEGADFLVREISAADAPVEVVAIAGAEESAKTEAPKAKALTEALSITLTVQDYPFLRSHVLDGKAVLPMAVIVEWLAHGALHGNPGFRFHGFNDLRICKGVVFEAQHACRLSLRAGRATKRDSSHLVPVELVSVGPNERPICHARAEIVLAGRLPEGIRSITEIPNTPYRPENGLIYHPERLFHGPDLHGIQEVVGCSAKGIAGLVKGAPAPVNWIKQPLRGNWLTDPLALDSAFQMMILWSFERFGSGSLPCFAGRYRQFLESFPREGVQVVIRVTSESAHGATADMEFLDRSSGKLVARLEGYECVIDPSLKQAFQRNQLNAAPSVAVGAA